MKIDLKVHFYNTDEMGVVHHANYIRWFETGRVEFLRSIGITLTEMIEDGYLFPITEISAKYHRSAKFDDDLQLETIPVALTKAKMEFNYKVWRGEEVLAAGFSQNVFTDSKTGKITRLPAKYFDRLKAGAIQ